MKKICFFILVLISFSCSKKNEVMPANSIPSYWEFNGKKYEAYTANWDFLNNNTLLADDNKGNTIKIIFSFIRKPTQTTTFMIKKGGDYPDFTDINQCTIQINDKFQADAKGYFYTKDNTTELTLSIAKTGKMNVSFRDVKMESFWELLGEIPLNGNILSGSLTLDY